MRDMLGNRLEAGNVVYWKEKDIIVQVLDVIEPKLTVPGQPPQQPAILLKFAIGVNPSREAGPVEDVMIPTLLRVVDPTAEALLDKALAGMPRQ